ncbi:MAG TPA: DUF4238 domain-containing protein, partial [Pyrinomonadaceae bacterium]
MGKGKHHYVPKLYLKAFSSRPRRINIYAFRTQQFVSDVGLKDQCQRPKFYGKTDAVEDDLMKLETIVTPVLRDIVRESRLPQCDSRQHAHLLLFVAFQLSRTPLAADNLVKGFNRIVDNIAAESSEFKEQSDEYRMKF